MVAQPAIFGSQSKIDYRPNAAFAYQDIEEHRRFDIINPSSYDLILGTPFVYQQKVLIGLNPTRVIIGSICALPIERSVRVRTARLREENLDNVQECLDEKATPLCKTAAETPFPPL